MGARSRSKWMNRHARRVLVLVKEQVQGDAPVPREVFDAAAVQAFKEVQARRASLSALRGMGLGLRYLLQAERNRERAKSALTAAAVVP